MPRLKKRQIVLLAIAAVILVGGITGGVYAARSWQKPLGESLGLPTRTPAPSNTPVPVQASPTAESTLVAAAPISTATTAPMPTATREPLCGGPEVMYLLGVGADSGYDYLYGLADAIRVARVDFVTPKVTMLTIPRDLWVEIPDLKPVPSDPDTTITHGKLNQAYFYGGPGMGYYEGAGGGPGLLARTLDLNFGLYVDHYGAINMQTFVKLVDAVGGIDLYLEKDVDGRPIDEKTKDMGYFTAGQKHLTGEAALRLSRIRKKYNDRTRGDNQNLVLCALKDKITSPSVLPKIPKIISAFKGAVQTDLSLEQLSQLACLAPQLSKENVIFTGLPEEILKPGRAFDDIHNYETFIYEADFDVIRDYVGRFLSGEWPNQPQEPSCP